MQRVLLAVVAFTTLTSQALAQKSYPMLMNLSPAAIQVGQASEHTVESRYSMFGANQVLISGEGVTGEVITPMELGKDGKATSAQIYDFKTDKGNVDLLERYNDQLDAYRQAAALLLGISADKVEARPLRVRS